MEHLPVSRVVNLKTALDEKIRDINQLRNNISDLDNQVSQKNVEILNKEKILKH